MSHRALLAERQQNNRFNVYHSRNGAENIQLLDELDESINVDGRVDWESLTGSTAPQRIQRMSTRSESPYIIEGGSNEHVVNPQPVAVNITQKEILLAADLLNYEVLYVVDNGDVTAYWLAWAFPNVIQPWCDHVEVEVYPGNKTLKSPGALLESLENSDPLRTISDFEEGWLSDGVVRDVVQGYHRWVYELLSMKTHEPNDDASKERTRILRLLQTPEYHLLLRVDRHASLVPGGHPFILPIQLDSPADASAMRIRDSAAQTRFCIGAGLHASDAISEVDVATATAEAIRELVDAHAGDVAAKFIPREMGQLVERYQQSHEWGALEDHWTQ